MQLPKIKFINSETNSETKMSWVTVQMRGKEYTGSSKCHPEDTWSEFTGCRYAEARAEIEALKDLYHQKKEACENFKDFIKSLECYKDFDKESPVAKTVYRQLNSRVKEVNYLADAINEREFNLLIAIKQQDKFKEKMKSKEDN